MKINFYQFFFKSLIIIFFLILFYIFYKSEIYYSSNNRSYYLVYYILILSIIFFSFISLYLKIIIQKYIIIFFLSSFFAFYFFEGVQIFSQKNIFFDKRSISDVYVDLKKTNPNVTVYVPPSTHLSENKNEFLSLAGISKAKTIYCNEIGYFSIYQSDRYGFNNPDEEWDSEEIEYLLIGDSLTHGACVNRPNDIASVLRLNKKKVLNLGQGGNGPLIEYATLREYLTPNIKKVIWLYFEGNDLYDLEIELKNIILNKYLKDQNFKQDLKIKQIQIDKYLNNLVEKSFRHEKKIIKFIKLFNTRNLLFSQTPTYNPPPPLIPPEMREILKSANELIQKYNGKLYFIYLPAISRYTNLDYSKNYDFKKDIKKIVNDLGIEFIDIDEEVFKKENNPLKLFPFEKKYHYNVEGYKKIAIKIYDKTK